MSYRDVYLKGEALEKAMLGLFIPCGNVSGTCNIN